MDELLVQRTRYVLRSRVRRVQTCPDELFMISCVQLLDWVYSHPLLSAIAKRLEQVPGEHNAHIDRIVRDISGINGQYDPGKYAATTSDQHAALCLKIIQSIGTSKDLGPRQRNLVIRLIRAYLDDGDSGRVGEAIKLLRDVAIDGFYEYIDEQLDARNAIYAILLKYKQRSEWFRKERLRSIADNGLERREGERALAIDLQEYILDQGAEFFIEPTSAGGEVDLVLRASEGRYLIIDAKYVPEGAPRSMLRDKLSSGLNQVTQYCSDFNEHEGFLVVFNRSSTRILIDSLKNSDGFPYMTIGGKAVYYLEVDIADSPSASKLGKAQELVFKAEDLKQVDH